MRNIREHKMPMFFIPTLQSKRIVCSYHTGENVMEASVKNTREKSLNVYFGTPWKRMLSVMAPVWFVLGATSYSTAVKCFNKSGRVQDHLGGLISAMLFGPLFWVFYFENHRYCR